MFQVFLLLCHLAYLLFSWSLHVHSWTSAHLGPWTAQGVITLCSSHSCLNDLDSFVLWKNLGSGAHSSVEWALSLRRCDVARECGVSVLRALFEFFAVLGRAAVLFARSWQCAQHLDRVCWILGV